MRNCEDWLMDYMLYTDNSEPPKLYHLWSGIMAISSCLQRKCWLPWGHSPIYPNLYTVLVGPPGGRKGTAMKIAKGMVRDLKVKLSPDCVTTQQLFRELVAAEANYRTSDGTILYHKSLSIWSEEFSVFIGYQNLDMVTALTDLFDCPDVWEYSTKTKGADDLSNTFLNLFGAITPRVLQSKLTQEAVGGGLISRIIFVVGYGKEKLVPLPFLSDQEVELYQSLVEDLARIRSLSGNFRFTQKAIEAYTEWYMNPANSNALDSDQFVGYNERRSLHLRKLCMIMAASQDDKMVIREDHFNKAVAILERTEREMPNAFFGLGRGLHAQTLSDLIRYFQTFEKVSWKDLLDRFKLDVGQEDLSKLLQLLESTGRIQRDQAISGGVQYQAINVNLEEQKPDYLDQTIFRKEDSQ